MALFERFLDSFSTRNRLRRLEEATEELYRKVKGLESEWNETLDKFNRLHGRIAKRAQIDANRGTSPQGQLIDTAPEPAMDDGAGLTLSPHHRTLQAQIMARRMAKLRGTN